MPAERGAGTAGAAATAPACSKWVPLPPTSTNQTAQEPPTVRWTSRLLFPTDAKLGLVHRRTVRVVHRRGPGQGALFPWALPIRQASATLPATTNGWSETYADITADFEAGPATIAGSYQFHSCTWGQPKGDDGGKTSGSAELSAELYQIKGALGYNTEGELSVSAGYDFIKTPKTWSKLAEASVGVEAEVSAPVKVHGLVRGGKTLSSSIAGYSAKLAKLLTRPVDCPYCSAKGQMDRGVFINFGCTSPRPGRYYTGRRCVHRAGSAARY